MLSRSALLLIAAVALVVTSEARGDWPEWRGPHRNGIAPTSPPLADSWPETGPPLLWEVSDLPGGGEGGYGSPVLSNGRVYLYIRWRYRVPLMTRTLSESELRRLGWVPEWPPPRILDALEASRTRPERAELRGQDLRDWIDAWVGEHLDEESLKRFGSFVRRRLSEGADALELELLERLAEIRNREFEDAGSLERWLAAAGIEGEARERVLSRVPTEERRSKDVILCLDAQKGGELWRWESPGKGSGVSSTVCVADGRCYALTSTREAICLDASTGKLIWKVPCAGNHSSFLVREGLAVVLADRLTALDAKTGAVVWTQEEVRGRENSPVAWQHGDTSYVICNTSKNVACVELRSGRLCWAVPGGGPSTAAVSGDRMAILTNDDEKGLLAYRISPDDARLLWRLEGISDRGASPLLRGDTVYAVGGSKTVGVDAATGRVLWEERPGRGDICSPILVGDSLLALLGRTLALLEVSREGCTRQAQARVSAARCSSPAFSDGRLYLRLADGLACYDLRENATGS